MVGCLILFLCNTIKYLVEVKDLTLTMIVVFGLQCFMMEFTFWWVCLWSGGTGRYWQGNVNYPEVIMKYCS